MFKFARTKRFLLNKESIYGKWEIVLNWLIVASLGLFSLFLLLFLVFIMRLDVGDPKKLAYIKLPEPVNTFSIITFLSFLTAISSFLFKGILKLWRWRKNEKSN